MNKKKEVLGVHMDNLTMQEAVAKVEEMLAHSGLGVVEFVTAEVLLEAEKSEVYREKLDSVDLCLPGDAAVLKAMEKDLLWADELEKSTLLKSVVRFLGEKNQSILILTEDEEVKTWIQKELDESAEADYNIRVMDVDPEVTDDVLVNKINSADADVIWAFLPHPYQENFVFENRKKLNAGLWIGVGDRIQTGFFGKMIVKQVLKRKVNRYQNEKND